MRISDWSSDVCSSDLALRAAEAHDLSLHHGHILAPTEDAPEELKDLEYLLAATDDDAFNALVCTRFAPNIGQQRVFQTPLAHGTGDQLDFGREWRGRIRPGGAWWGKEGGMRWR